MSFCREASEAGSLLEDPGADRPEVGVDEAGVRLCSVPDLLELEQLDAIASAKTASNWT